MNHQEFKFQPTKNFSVTTLISKNLLSDLKNSHQEKSILTKNISKNSKLEQLVSPEKLVKKMFSKSFSPLNQNLQNKYLFKKSNDRAHLRVSKNGHND